MSNRAVPPERVRLLLDLLASGLNPRQASAAAGVSKTFAYGVHHKMGGVYRPPCVTYSARYLSREERYEIARLRDSGLGVRAIAARLGRSPSTISRELEHYQPRKIVVPPPATKLMMPVAAVTLRIVLLWLVKLSIA